MEVNKGNQIKVVGKMAKQKLMHIQMYPLTIVTAPMGYGKTLAVQNASSQSKAKVEWYDEKVPLWQPAEGYTEETWVVLDNYHKFTDIDIYYTALMQVIKKEIKHLHIILITRVMPTLSIEEMRFKQECQVVDCEDLKLTGEEVKEYLECNAISIQDEEAQAVAEYIGGWPTAIYLMKENYMNYNHLYHKYSLFNLIREGIYSMYEVSYQHLLVTLAGIGPFKMEDWINMKDYAKYLEGIRKILKDNLLKYDYKTGHYSFTPLMIDFLQQELDLQAQGELSESCKYIGTWHLTKKNWNEGFKYLIKSGNKEQFMKCLQEVPLQDYRDIDKVAMSKIFNQIEQSFFVKYPIGGLRLLYYFLFYKDHKQIQNILNQVEQALLQTDTLEDETKVRIRGEIYAIKGIVASENVAGIAENLENVVECLPEGSSIVNGLDMFNRHYIHLSYRYHTAIGKYEKNIKEMVQLMKAYSSLKYIYSIEMQYLIYAEYYMYRGEWEEAKNCASKLFYKTDISKNYVMRLCSELILGRIALGCRDEYQCNKYLKNIENYQPYEESKTLREIRDIGVVYIKGCLGDAKEQFQEKDLREILGNVQEQTIGISTYIAYAQVLIEKKEWIKLEILQDVVGESLANSRSIFGQIYYYVFQALWRSLTDHPEEAKAMLKKAIEIAQVDKITLPFKERIEVLTPVLTELGKEERFKAFILPLLQDSKKLHLEDTRKEETPHKASNAWGLTKREYQITQLIREGFTNRQIAEQLYVANVTVAKTTSNIYKKMGVNNRIEMIRKMD